MESSLYQRPREKLQSKGVETLSTVELLQVILGSGSKKAPGAKIARYVEGLLNDHVVRYDTLVGISGIGNAKACQILAVCELAQRLHFNE